MVEHISSEQLSAHLDGALAGRAAEQVERHLAACEQCRGALATLAAQDASLRPALTHDPGDAYFESFAGRVGDRIRAAGLAGAQARGQGFDLGRLFRSPRALAWAGGVAVLVVGAGLALMTSREIHPPDLRDRDLAERAQPAAPEGAKETEAVPPAGTTAQEAVPPAAMDRRERDDAAQGIQGGAEPRSQEAIVAPGAPVADEERAEPAPQNRRPMPSSAVTGGKADRLSGPPPAKQLATGRASPGRAVEVQRNEAGEDVPVRRAGESRALPPPAPAAAGTAELGQIRKKLAAEPLKDAKTQGTMALDSGAAKPESAAGEYSFAKPPAGSPPLASPLGERPSVATKQTLVGEALVPGEAKLCGEVRDAAGRPVVGAQVTVADIGRTATSDAHGAFCLNAPAGEHPLSVMAVGFAESRQTVRVGGEGATVRVTLEAVSVLEDKRGAISGRVPLPRIVATPPGEPSDNYARLPDTLRSTVRAAQQLETSAAARRSARLFDSAAAGWERALKRLEGGPLEVETRLHLAEARYRAWEAGPNARRATAAVEALTAYALRAPAGAEREQAIRWLDRVKH